ncbi:NAD(P)H-dependent oxidoreductase [Stappia sp.]|jgi:putative NADPH-quinone reductase|uniref:NAD(P)H-dependent oxidoreductase n=1 Tax=Stappia sp. TaxID=1870903 RepID=UPI003A98EA29
MRVLLIFCHPSSDSFGAALAATVRAALDEAGHEVRFTDLYRANFHPALGEAEWRRYENAELNRLGIEGHVEDIEWAQSLVFVYPTWWYGLPAMLKGYLDRVWVPHVTFTMPTETTSMRPRMQHIRKIAVVTTCGATWWLSKLVGEPGRKTVLRGIRALCAPFCRTRYLAHYKMDSSTPESRKAYLEKVRRTMARW